MNKENQKRRIKQHLYDLNLNKHCNKKLQNSFNKYGISNFSIYLFPINISRSALFDLEMECIKNLEKINGDKKFIFASKTGKYVSPSNFGRMFRGIQKALNYEHILGLHSLRHTFATLMLNNGIDVKIVSELLGHSNVSVTYNIYIHTIQSQKIKAINMIEDGTISATQQP